MGPRCPTSGHHLKHVLEIFYSLRQEVSHSSALHPDVSTAAILLSPLLSPSRCVTDSHLTYYSFSPWLCYFRVLIALFSLATTVFGYRRSAHLAFDWVHPLLPFYSSILLSLFCFRFVPFQLGQILLVSVLIVFSFSQ